MAQFTVTSAQWTKIASAGSTVELQNLSTYPARVTVSAAVPVANADGEVLFGVDSTRKFDSALPSDLYAIALTANAAIIEVMPIGASGGGGGGGGGSGGAVTIADGAAATLGNTGDAVWSGAGAGTLIAVGKALWSRLGSVVLAAGGAVIGKVGLQVGGTDVGPSNAVPVSPQPAYPASGKTPVTGAFTAVGQSASYAPLAGRGFNIALWGTFVASIQLERSFDGGTTWLPITAAGTQLYKWTAPASESNQEDESGPVYRLNCTVFSSGTVNYRVSQ